MTKWSKNMKTWEKAKAEHDKAEAKLAEQQSEKGAGKAKTSSKKTKTPLVSPGPPPPEPRKQMDPLEVPIFLKLSTALKLLLSSSISEEQLIRGETLLREYLTDFRNVRFFDINIPPVTYSQHL